MYKQENIDEINKVLKKFINKFILATIVFLVITAVVCINWGTEIDPYRLPVAIGYTFAVIYAIGAVFAWGMIGVRLIKYRSFVKDMLSGLEHEVEGNVERIDKEPVLDNDLKFYQVELKTQETETNRLIYFDATKDISLINVGDNVNLKTHGKYIKEVII